MELIQSLGVVLEASKQLSSWCIGMLGGSLIAVISTSYHRPESLAHRLPYLLFVPGWGLLVGSLYYSDAVSNQYLAALMAKSEFTYQIAEGINDDFVRQRSLFSAALLTFGVWAVAFLCQWVFVGCASPRQEVEV